MTRQAVPPGQIWLSECLSSFSLFVSLFVRVYRLLCVLLQVFVSLSDLFTSASVRFGGKARPVPCIPTTTLSILRQSEFSLIDGLIVSLLILEANHSLHLQRNKSRLISFQTFVSNHATRHWQSRKRTKIKSVSVQSSQQYLRFHSKSNSFLTLDNSPLVQSTASNFGIHIIDCVSC
jgi:hypothetical protein